MVAWTYWTVRGPVPRSSVEHGGGELLEVDLPDRRDDVAFGLAAVLGPGAGADLGLDGG
jgi:hypothetical protein